MEVHSGNCVSVCLEPFGSFLMAVPNMQEPIYIRWRTREGHEYIASFVLDGKYGSTSEYRLFTVEEVQQ